MYTEVIETPIGTVRRNEYLPEDGKLTKTSGILDDLIKGAYDALWETGIEDVVVPVNHRGFAMSVYHIFAKDCEHALWLPDRVTRGFTHQEIVDHICRRAQRYGNIVYKVVYSEWVSRPLGKPQTSEKKTVISEQADAYATYVKNLRGSEPVKSFDDWLKD